MRVKVVELMTREGCCLCDDAHAVLEQVRAAEPFELRVVDVDGDAELRARYGLEVPVVLIDGRKAFKFRVDAESMLTKLRRGA
jgi:hypothetical protein